MQSMDGRISLFEGQLRHLEARLDARPEARPSPADHVTAHQGPAPLLLHNVKAAFGVPDDSQPSGGGGRKATAEARIGSLEAILAAWCPRYLRLEGASEKTKEDPAKRPQGTPSILELKQHVDSC